MTDHHVPTCTIGLRSSEEREGEGGSGCLFLTQLTALLYLVVMLAEYATGTPRATCVGPTTFTSVISSIA